MMNSLRYVHENVIAPFDWRDEAMSLAAAEAFDGAEDQRVSHCAIGTE